VPKLSDPTIRALIPRKGQFDVWDATLPSFGVRVSQGGSKTFVLKLHNVRRTIGRYPLISLSQARLEARRLMAERTLGRVHPRSITFAHARSLFLADKERAAKPSTLSEYARLLNRLPFKGQLSAVSHEDVSRELNKIKFPSEHAHVVVAAKVFFNWSIKRRFITDNPMLGLSHRPSTARARVLSEAEVKSIWNAVEGTFGKIVKLLILTGQRRGEIAALRPAFFTHDICTLPASLTKNGREHSFPIGPLAVSLVVSALPSAAPYLFAARRKPNHPFNGWGKCKAALDKKSGVTEWTLHDLRRTFATQLASLGTPIHITERLLNHVSGTQSGIVAVYQRHDYMPDMRAAMTRYEDHLAALFAKQ
jgi:integrase